MPGERHNEPGKRSLHHPSVLGQKRPDQKSLTQDRVEAHRHDEQERSDCQGDLLHSANHAQQA